MKWKFWKREASVETPAPGSVKASGAQKAYAPASTPWTALTVSAAYRAVDYLSDQVAMLPLLPKRWNQSERRYVDWTERALWRLLTIRPDGRRTPFAVWKEVVADVLLYGNAIIVPERRGGEYSRLVLVEPQAVGYDKIRDTYYIEDMTSGVHGTFSGSEVLHFKNLSLDGGYTGVSVLTFARRTLTLAATSDQEQLDRVATGGRYKAVLTNAEFNDGKRGFGQYDDGELVSLAEDISDKLAAGKDVIAVPGDGKLTPLSMTSTDLQFLESRKFTVSDVARFFGVPPAKLMDTTGAVYKSAESATNAFYVDTLAPLLTMIEQELRAKLVPPELAWRYKFEFDPARLWSMDPKSRASYEAQQLANGALTVNELRALYDRPPVDGGDTLMLSSSLSTSWDDEEDGATGGGDPGVTSGAPTSDGTENPNG